MAEKITKSELIEAVIDVNPKLSQAAAKDVVDTVFDTIIDCLKNDGVVDIRGFGKFSVKTRAGRTGINPMTKEKIEIAETKAPAFKPSNSFKEIFK